MGIVGAERSAAAIELLRASDAIVRDPGAALRSGEAAYALFPRMRELATEMRLPTGDLAFMEDTFRILLLARRFHFGPEGAGLEALRVLAWVWLLSRSTRPNWLPKLARKTAMGADALLECHASPREPSARANVNHWMTLARGAGASGPSEAAAPPRALRGRGTNPTRVATR